MRRQHQIVALGLLLLLLSTGCMGSSPESEATLGEIQIEAQSERPVITFNQTIASDSTATVTLESPNGSTVSEQMTRSDNGVNRITVPNPTAGEYTLKLIRKNKTTDTKTVTITPPELRANINADWGTTRLSQAVVEVKNEGYLPTDSSVSIYKGTSKVYNTTSQTVIAGDPATFSITPTGGLYTAGESGSVKLRVVIEGDEETIEKTISHTVQSATVRIGSVTPVWQTNNLRDVTYSITNNGDLPANLVGNITTEGNEVIKITDVDIAGNKTKEFSARDSADVDSGPLYNANTGSIETQVTLKYNNSTVSASNTTTVTSTSSTLRNVETMWTSTYGSDVGLSDVSFTLRTGDSSLSYSTIKIESGNQTVVEDGLNSATILSGVQVQRSYYVGGNNQIEVPPGEHELTISLLNGDELLTERAVSVTATAS